MSLVLKGMELASEKNLSLAADLGLGWAGLSVVGAGWCLKISGVDKATHPSSMALPPSISVGVCGLGSLRAQGPV